MARRLPGDFARPDPRVRHVCHLQNDPRVDAQDRRSTGGNAMTVSAKIPVSRPGGSPSGGGGAGPIAAPRVVNNRRIRTGGILLAVLLLVLGAALSGLALLSATRTSAYLAVAKQVPVGQTVQASDLKTVELSGGQGLEAIPANQINTVVGRRAA